MVKKRRNRIGTIYQENSGDEADRPEAVFTTGSGICRGLCL